MRPTCRRCAGASSQNQYEPTQAFSRCRRVAGEPALKAWSLARNRCFRPRLQRRKTFREAPSGSGQTKHDRLGTTSSACPTSTPGISHGHGCSGLASWPRTGGCCGMFPCSEALRSVQANSPMIFRPKIERLHMCTVAGRTVVGARDSNPPVGPTSLCKLERLRSLRQRRSRPKRPRLRDAAGVAPSRSARDFSGPMPPAQNDRA